MAFFKRQKNTQNTHGPPLLYPGEMKLHTLLYKWGFAGLLTTGKVKVRTNVSKIIVLLFKKCSYKPEIQNRLVLS